MLISLLSLIVLPGEETPPPVPRAKSYYYFNDEPAKTRYGYISGYTGDDRDGHFFILSVVLGYSLMQVSPNFDRVLMIPTEMKIPEERMQALRKVWTHIIYRPYVQWPEGHLYQRDSDKYLWFKLNAWSVTGWEKLLWTGNDVFFRRDPSRIFDFPTPTSIIDHYIYSMGDYGPITNGDFFLFRPSLRDYAGLKKLGLTWNAKRQKSSWTGSIDQGLIAEYFEGNITVAPQWYQFEVPGNVRSMLGYNSSQPDPRIISFHFPSLAKPWRRHAGAFTTAWVNVAHAAFRHIGSTVDLDGLGFPPAGNVSSAFDMVIDSEPVLAEPALNPDNDDGIDPHILFPQTLFRSRRIFRVFLLVLFINLLIYGAISSNKPEYTPL